MRADSPRWREVTASEFPHEREGLAHVRELLPDRKPFRAWSNFEFRDQHGKWHEVDLLVLGERRLHLVELKSCELTIRLSRGHPQVNIVCGTLAAEDLIVRDDSFRPIRNRLAVDAPTAPHSTARRLRVRVYLVIDHGEVVEDALVGLVRPFCCVAAHSGREWAGAHDRPRRDESDAGSEP